MAPLPIRIAILFYIFYIKSAHVDAAVAKNSVPFDPFRLECPFFHTMIRLDMQLVESTEGVRSDTLLTSYCENIKKLFPAPTDPTLTTADESCRWTEVFKIPGENFLTRRTCTDREFLSGLSRQATGEYGFLCCKIKDRKRGDCVTLEFKLPSAGTPSVELDGGKKVLTGIGQDKGRLLAQFCDLEIMSKKELDDEFFKDAQERLRLHGEQAKVKSTPKDKDEKAAPTSTPNPSGRASAPAVRPPAPSKNDKDDNEKTSESDSDRSRHDRPRPPGFRPEQSSREKSASNRGDRKEETRRFEGQSKGDRGRGRSGETRRASDSRETSRREEERRPRLEQEGSEAVRDARRPAENEEIRQSPRREEERRGPGTSGGDAIVSREKSRRDSRERTETRRPASASREEKTRPADRSGPRTKSKENGEERRPNDRSGEKPNRKGAEEPQRRPIIPDGPRVVVKDNRETAIAGKLSQPSRPPVKIEEPRSEERKSVSTETTPVSTGAGELAVDDLQFPDPANFQVLGVPRPVQVETSIPTTDETEISVSNETESSDVSVNPDELDITVDNWTVDWQEEGNSTDSETGFAKPVLRIGSFGDSSDGKAIDEESGDVESAVAPPKPLLTILPPITKIKTEEQELPPAPELPAESAPDPAPELPLEPASAPAPPEPAPAPAPELASASPPSPGPPSPPVLSIPLPFQPPPLFPSTSTSTTSTTTTTQTTTTTTTIPPTTTFPRLECESGASLRDNRTGLILACGQGDDIWVPSRCQPGQLCLLAKDSAYRLCCRPRFP